MITEQGLIVFSVDCALKLQEGLADFGVFTAEQALLASHFIDKSVQVIADMRHVERLEGSSLFIVNRCMFMYILHINMLHHNKY